MMIRNFNEIATSRDKKTVLSIIEKGLNAAQSSKYLRRIVRQDHLEVQGKKIPLWRYSHVYVIAIGKSADLMTKTLISNTKVHGGIVVIPRGMKPVFRRKGIKIMFSTHPIPSRRSVEAATKISSFLRSKEATDFVIFLISGGASS